MEIMPLEVYSDLSNYAIIKPPGRNFPGCVIQGDSLKILCNRALTIARHAKAGTLSDEECLGEIEELANSLLDRLLHYQSVLREHGVELPYRPEFSEADFVKLSDSDPGEAMDENPT